MASWWSSRPATPAPPPGVCPIPPSTRTSWRWARPTPTAPRPTSDDTVTDYSSRGDGTRNPYLVAPGQHVASLRVPGSFVDQQYGNGPGSVDSRFFRGSGTSQAAAMVSGAAALASAATPWAVTRPGQVAADRRRPTPLRGTDRTAAGHGEVNVARRSSPRPTRSARAGSRPPGSGSLEGGPGRRRPGPQRHPAHRRTSTSSGHRRHRPTGHPRGRRGGMDREVAGTATPGPRRLARHSPGPGWRGHRTSWDSGSGWTGLSWDDGTWTGLSWDNSTWTGLSWDTSQWSGTSWQGLSWDTYGWS